MIDVTKLRRMNELAKTLRTQGIVSNQEEASFLAAEIAGTKDEGIIMQGMRVNGNQELVVVNAPVRGTNDMLSSPQTGSYQPQNYSGTRDYYTKTEIESVLQKLVDKVTAEIDRLDQQFEQQVKNIRFLNEAIEQLKKGAVITCNPTENPQAKLNVANVAQEVAAENTSATPSASTPNARTGGFKSDDVAIDKFFYYGTKR